MDNNIADFSAEVETVAPSAEGENLETPPGVIPDQRMFDEFCAAFSPGRPLRLSFLDQRKDRKSKLTPYETDNPDDQWSRVAGADEAGYAGYYHVNGVTAGPGSGRGGAATDKDVFEVRALAIDCDAGLPEEWHQPPDFVVYTSVLAGTENDPIPTWKGQALWLVDDCPRDQYETAQRRLIAHYGSDPAVKDLRRILRLPGSVHRKNPMKPYPVTFRREYVGPVRSLAVLTADLPEVEPAVHRTGDCEAVTPGWLVRDHAENINLARRKIAKMIERSEVAHNGVDGNSNLGRAAIQCKRCGVELETATALLWESTSTRTVNRRG